MPDALRISSSHPRSFSLTGVPNTSTVHYLPLIERKINALDQAAPLAEWNLPPEFATLRRLMEARMTGALLDRLTHHVNILEMNGDSYRLAQSRARNAG